MKEFINKKVLVTCQNWFYGADGKQYKAIHGTLKAIHESGKELGFIPNRSHANWYFEIGEMVIMGCQIMYVLQCDTVHNGYVTDWNNDNTEKQIVEYDRPTAIYIVK